MKRWLKEPLLHFVLLGIALFVLFAVVSGDEGPSDDRIVVSAGKVEHLTALFERTWQRPPTRIELEGVINDFVREEVAYREGLAIGLDRDDTIIRRRMRQKIEFVAEDLIDRVAPTDEELEAYLAAHPDDFRVDPHLDLRHIFLDPTQRGDALENDARELLVRLEGDHDTDISTLGDRILIAPEFIDASQREIGGLFGRRFAESVVALEPGSWTGPIESGYGMHLVQIVDRRGGRLPTLDEVRAEVEREWTYARRQEATDEFYTQMIERYDVEIEWPDGAQP